MRALPATLSFAAALAACVPPVIAGETATASISVSVQVSSRTSLKVSSDVLHFDVAESGASATAAVEFAAGARVPPGADLVLTVEPQRSIEHGGASDVETSVRFDGEGDGTLAGTLLSLAPSVAGRWKGSGMRRGRVRFTLHANAAGDYVLPVRFVLSTP